MDKPIENCITKYLGTELAMDYARRGYPIIDPSPAVMADRQYVTRSGHVVIVVELTDSMVKTHMVGQECGGCRIVNTNPVADLLAEIAHGLLKRLPEQLPLL